MDANLLVPALQQTLANDTHKTREATRYLEDQAKASGFTIGLLGICGNASVDLNIRMAAALFVKNHIKRNWEDDESGLIAENDRLAIRAGIVRLMLQVPPLVQRQISDALAHISKFDFPEKWPTLLPELVSELRGAADINVLNGVLETANAVFERFRNAYDTDEARYPLKVALDNFAGPLTEAFTKMDAQVEEATRSGAPKATQVALYHALKTMTSIFYSLNWLDLPEFFEDHMPEWMAWYHKYLNVRNPVVSAVAADDEEGALEQLQSGILECVALYAEKYDEEFEAYFSTFVQDVWALMSSQKQDKAMSTNMDNLVTRAIKFLSSVVAKPSHASMFAAEASLRAMMEHVIVPNICLREQDVELFEDNPADFIRGDIEGNNTDTRRRVATDLIRSLCRNFNAAVTPVAIEYVNRMIAEYEADKKDRTVRKDGAVALMIAVAVKSQTESGGVTAVNELVSLLDFLTKHILPELSDANSANPSACNDRPIAKASAIKFIATFRSLFGRNELHSLLPLLSPLLAADSFVVHTYAAAAIERVLTVKDKDAATGKSQPRVSVDALAPVLPSILQSLFTRIAADTYPENEYLMRCIMRVVVISKDRLAPLAGNMIGALTTVLGRVCRNPSNPSYNHYLFETIASMMRSICIVKPEAVADFEAMLLPPFNIVLQADVMEFLPYVFQLLAELLELKPFPGAVPPAGQACASGPGSPSQGGHVLSEPYKQLLVPCLQAVLWQRKGNVPALTELMAAYIHKGSAYILETQQLMPLLGVWQKLINSKNQEQFAFTLLDALITSTPLNGLAPQLPAIMHMTLGKVHSSRALRIARMFVHSSALMCGVHGPGVYEQVLDSFGAGTFYQVLEAVIAATANRILRADSRREAAIGLVRILSETQALLADASKHALWTKVLSVVVELISGGPPPDPSLSGKAAVAAAAANAAGGGNAHAADGTNASGAFAEEGDEEEHNGAGGEAEALPAEYTAAYSRLVHAGAAHAYAFPSLPEPRQYLALQLAAAGQRCGPGVVSGLVARSPVAATVQQICAAAGIALP